MSPSNQQRLETVNSQIYDLVEVTLTLKSCPVVLVVEGVTNLARVVAVVLQVLVGVTLTLDDAAVPLQPQTHR